MPIEIKELHIKVTVGNQQDNSNDQEASEGDKEKIIAACIEQIMEILSKKEER